MLLIERIREAFPPVRYFGVMNDCPCDECTELRVTLQRRSWDEIPASFIDLRRGPGLLTDTAVHAFLPAFMIRAFEDPALDNITLRFTVYSLCPSLPEDDDPPGRPPTIDRLQELARLFSPAQCAAIRAFLDHAAHRDKWLQLQVEQAIQAVWQTG